MKLPYKLSGTMDLFHGSQSQKNIFGTDTVSNRKNLCIDSLTHRVRSIMDRKEGQVEGPRTALPQPSPPC